MVFLPPIPLRGTRMPVLTRLAVVSRGLSHTHSHKPPRSAAAAGALASNNTAEPPRSNRGPAFKYFSQRDARFVLSATSPEQYKNIPHSPEVTFAGRSNVGKSSLINAILRSNQLVKTSRSPGHTSALNFFSLTSGACAGAISVVDMPGYGFRSRDEWGQFIMKYLATRKVLRRVFLLVEAKVGELKATDLSFLELAEGYKVQVQIVLTKIDKLKQADLDKISQAISRSAIDVAPSAVQPTVLYCSSRTKVGIEALQLELLRVCDMEPEAEQEGQEHTGQKANSA